MYWVIFVLVWTQNIGIWVRKGKNDMDFWAHEGEVCCMDPKGKKNNEKCFYWLYIWQEVCLHVIKIYFEEGGGFVFLNK